MRLTERQIAGALGVARSTVHEVLDRADPAQLTWPLPSDLSLLELERQLYPVFRGRPRQRPEPDWSAIHRELQRPPVTLQLLWREYHERHPEGYQYSQYCARYRTWTHTIEPAMRQPQRAHVRHEMAEHYGTVVLPARPRKPRDKGPVENHVHRIEQWVIAPLRNQTFFTDGALQQAIQTQVDGINARPFQKLDGSRVTWWETLDRPALRPLPPTPYE